MDGNEFLKSHNVPVILGLTQALPSRDDDDIDQAFKTAAQLHEKGILFAFTSNGSWRQRNLPFKPVRLADMGFSRKRPSAPSRSIPPKFWVLIRLAALLRLEKTLRCSSVKEMRWICVLVSSPPLLYKAAKSTSTTNTNSWGEGMSRSIRACSVVEVLKC